MKRDNFGYDDLGKLFNAEQTVSCKMIPRCAILIQLLLHVSRVVTYLIVQHRCNRCSSTIRRFVFKMKYDASTKYCNLVFGSVEISVKIF